MWKKIRQILDPELDLPDWLPVPGYLIKITERSRMAMLLLWIYAYYVRFLTIPGRLVIAVSLLIAFYSVILFHTPVLILTFSLLALFIVDFVIGFVFRPKVDMKRIIPSRVRAESILEVVYELSNKRFFAIWNLSIDMLHNRHGVQYVDEPAYTDYVRGKEEKKILRVKLVSGKRGRYDLPMPIAESAFPFCIFKWSCRIKDSQNLLVYPKFEPLMDFVLPVGKKYQREGRAMLSKVGESMDIHSCREFRVGDDPRHIHWASTARLGELIVKEYQEEYLSRIALILDTYIPKPTGLSRFFFPTPSHFDEFEAGISLAAAIVDFLTRGDLIVDIFAAGREVYHFQGGRSIATFDHILDILACLEPSREEALGKLESAVMEEIAEIGSAVVVLLNWNNSSKRLVEQLRSHGVVVKIIIINENRDILAGDDVTVLHHDDVNQGQVTVI